MANLPEKWDGNTPKWALFHYDGAEQEFSDWLYSVVFWDLWQGVAESLSDVEAQARMEAEARQKTLARTFDIRNVAERAKAYQLLYAKRTVWFHHLRSEPESIREMLQDMIDDEEEGSSEYVDLHFAIDTLLPALEKLGLPGEKLISIPAKWSKTRAAIPTLRRALDQQQGEQLEQTVQAILEGISDDHLPVREFREQLRGKVSQSRVPAVGGEVYVLPEGNMLVLRSLSPIQQRAIEMALKGLVAEWSIRDAFEMVRDLGSLLLKRETPPIEQGYSYSRNGGEDG